MDHGGGTVRSQWAARLGRRQVAGQVVDAFTPRVLQARRFRRSPNLSYLPGSTFAALPIATVEPRSLPDDAGRRLSSPFSARIPPGRRTSTPRALRHPSPATVADIDLWEFFLSLPAGIKFPDYRMKGFVRNALRGDVPDEIDRRDKTYADRWFQTMALDYPALGVGSAPSTRFPGSTIRSSATSWRERRCSSRITCGPKTSRRSMRSSSSGVEALREPRHLAVARPSRAGRHRGLLARPTHVRVRSPPAPEGRSRAHLVALLSQEPKQDECIDQAARTVTADSQAPVHRACQCRRGVRPPRQPLTEARRATRRGNGCRRTRMLTSANCTHTRVASRNFSRSDSRVRSDIGRDPLNDVSEQIEPERTVEVPDRDRVDEGSDALEAACRSWSVGNLKLRGQSSRIASTGETRSSVIPCSAFRSSTKARTGTGPQSPRPARSSE